MVALTKIDIKALREADSVCFDHASNDDKNLSCGIRAIKRGKPPWYEDKTHQVSCLSTVHIYSEDAATIGIKSGEKARCFSMIHSARYSEEWNTITKLLREGDELELRWMGLRGDGYLGRARVTDPDPSCNDAGLGEKLYHDKLFIHIRCRGKRKYSFYLEDSITPENSAKMIRL